MTITIEEYADKLMKAFAAAGVAKNKHHAGRCSRPYCLSRHKRYRWASSRLRTIPSPTTSASSWRPTMKSRPETMKCETTRIISRDCSPLGVRLPQMSSEDDAKERPVVESSQDCSR